jgi:hypothetical protein
MPLLFRPGGECACDGEDVVLHPTHRVAAAREAPRAARRAVHQALAHLPRSLDRRCCSHHGGGACGLQWTRERRARRARVAHAGGLAHRDALAGGLEFPNRALGPIRRPWRG